MDTKVLLLLLSPLLVSLMVIGTSDAQMDYLPARRCKVIQRFNGYKFAEVERARCDMVGEEVSGTTNFTQEGGSQFTKLEGYVTGLSEGKHGFHIHQKGNLSDGCMAAGPHFNPYDLNHGGLTGTVRHAGDLGNIIAGSDGIARFTIEATQILLNGIIGRTLILGSVDQSQV